VSASRRRAACSPVPAGLRRIAAGGAAARVEEFFVTVERAATFRQGPGTRGAARPDVGLPGVFVAGAWTDTGWPATMEGAGRSGSAAARAALDRFAQGVPRR
jgi:hypothetical protein